MMTDEHIHLKPLRHCPALLPLAARWFHEKWGIPEETYRESMEDCLRQRAPVPQWYLVLSEGRRIIAGAGVIDNDFHDRKDLAPNLCALFVEQEYRSRGVARYILDFARVDLGGQGVEKLYLITDHVGFYERCGWDFSTMVTGDDGQKARLYAAPTL